MHSATDIVRLIALSLPPLILSLSVHEWAHAWSAYLLGDPTAKMEGRLTVDPVAHADLFGTVLFPCIGIAMGGGWLFGWAKPVPVDMRYFKKPRLHMAIVAAAGPLSNIILAVALAILFGVLTKQVFTVETLAQPGAAMTAGLTMIHYAIQTNVMLAFFNLIPLPPLDGSRIVQGFVSAEVAHKIDRLAPQTTIILFVLLFTGALRFLLIPAGLFYQLLARLFM